MCVIAVSKKGVRQPTKAELLSMWKANQDGAGYMFSKNGQVEIHKGFMSFTDFYRAVRSESFTKEDSVVYHFRISTQGGINAEMTHPFPLCADLSMMSALDVYCDIGIAHNGIIPLTSSRYEQKYSDTALFVANYLSRLVHSEADLLDDYTLEMISTLARSKLAILSSSGEVYTIGNFIERDGILLSNVNHVTARDYDNNIRYIYRDGRWSACSV